MDFDFDKMATLAATNAPAFEAERKRLISEQLLSIPEDKRAKYEALQAELDVLRAGLPPDQFMNELVRRLQENLLDLNDQLNAIQTMVENKQDEKPRLAHVNRVALTGSGFNFGTGDDIIIPK